MEPSYRTLLTARAHLTVSHMHIVNRISSLTPNVVQVGGTPLCHYSYHEWKKNCISCIHKINVKDGAKSHAHVLHHVCSKWSLYHYTSHACRTSRLCPKTTTINGVTLPKGAVLYIPELQLHQSEEHWPDPDRFDPERLIRIDGCNTQFHAMQYVCLLCKYSTHYT